MKELKRKGKAIGIKPREVKAPNTVRSDASDTPIAKPSLTLTQKLVIAWMDRAVILNLLPSDKKYKEAQLEFMLDIANKIGSNFPSEIMEELRLQLFQVDKISVNSQTLNISRKNFIEHCLG